MIELVVPDAVLPPPSTMEEHLARHRRVMAALEVSYGYEIERGLSPLELLISRRLRDEINRRIMGGP